MPLHQSILRQLLTAPASLADLQAATQVSLPTLRKAVQELSEAHWIRVVGQAEANGGRPAMLFGMDDLQFAVIGLHLQLPGLRLILSDLNGQVLDERALFDEVVPTLNETARAVSDYVARIRARFPERRLLGIGIAAPGFIDPASGDIIAIGRVPSWRNLPLCHHIQAAVDLPIEIANDVDCMAFAEFNYTRESLDKNLAYAGFDEGLKVSMFLNGQIYKGSLGNAGLISSSLLCIHNQPDPEEVRKLISILGMNRAFEQRITALDEASREQYAGLLAVTNPRERLQLVISNARAAMPVCYAIIQDLIKGLSVAIANLIYIVQPDVVVIGGLLSSLPADIFPSLETAIRNYLPELINNKTVLRKGQLASQNSAALGATYHFLQKYLNNASIELV
jgi:predicted NBD/HSP70 family sugar kinase